jgi:hypothetical protein
MVWQSSGDRGTFIDMQEYLFEVRLVAVVRVRARNENLAREVATSALGSPSTEEIRLANEADFLMGREATIIAANFSVDESSTKLIEDGGKTVDQ